VDKPERGGEQNADSESSERDTDDSVDIKTNDMDSSSTLM